MKFLIILGLAAYACAEDYVPIVKSDYNYDPASGGFQYAYETGNGIHAEAVGVVKNPNSENAAIEVKGSYKYTSPEGQPIQLSYVADEHGFQPQADFLPTPPPVPAAILRSLEYIAAHPSHEDHHHAGPSHSQAPSPPRPNRYG